MGSMDSTTSQQHGFSGEAQEGRDGGFSVNVGDQYTGHDVSITDLTETDDAEGLDGEEATDDAAPDAPEAHAEPVVGKEDDAEAMSDGLLSEEARYARWQARRPPVSHLKKGVVFPPGTSGPLPLFDVGSRIVIEQRTELLDPRPDPLDVGGAVRHPWLRTVVGIVRSIDDDTGHVVLQVEGDTHVAHFSMAKETTQFFMAPSYGDPFDVSAIRSAEKAAAKAAALTAQTGSNKRGRGRPPGSKNRPKADVEAERAAIKLLQQEKKQRSNARRGIR